MNPRLGKIVLGLSAAGYPLTQLAIRRLRSAGSSRHRGGLCRTGPARRRHGGGRRARPPAARAGLLPAGWNWPPPWPPVAWASSPRSTEESCTRARVDAGPGGDGPSPRRRDSVRSAHREIPDLPPTRPGAEATQSLIDHSGGASGGAAHHWFGRRVVRLLPAVPHQLRGHAVARDPPLLVDPVRVPVPTPRPACRCRSVQFTRLLLYRHVGSCSSPERRVKSSWNRVLTRPHPIDMVTGALSILQVSTCTSGGLIKKGTSYEHHAIHHRRLSFDAVLRRRPRGRVLGTDRHRRSDRLVDARRRWGRRRRDAPLLDG